MERLEAVMWNSSLKIQSPGETHRATRRNRRGWSSRSQTSLAGQKLECKRHPVRWCTRRSDRDSFNRAEAFAERESAQVYTGVMGRPPLSSPSKPCQKAEPEM